MNAIEKRLKALEIGNKMSYPDMVTVLFVDGSEKVVPWDQALFAVLSGEVETASGVGGCADLVEVMLYDAEKTS